MDRGGLRNRVILQGVLVHELDAAERHQHVLHRDVELVLEHRLDLDDGEV